MRLELSPVSKKQRIGAAEMVDYSLFKRRFSSPEVSQRRLIGKFNAARKLMTLGAIDVYVDAVLHCRPSTARFAPEIVVDTCGVDGENLTVGICQETSTGDTLMNVLEVLEKAKNTRTMIFHPVSTRKHEMSQRFRKAIEAGKFIVEQAHWLDEQVEGTLRQAIELVDLLANETRVKMLLPLLNRTYRKRDYREDINPKLLYENLSTLIKSGLVDELEEDRYTLTEVGKDLLGEYISFLERVGRFLGESERV